MFSPQGSYNHPTSSTNTYHHSSSKQPPTNSNSLANPNNGAIPANCVKRARSNDTQNVSPIESRLHPAVKSNGATPSASNSGGGGSNSGGGGGGETRNRRSNSQTGSPLPSSNQSLFNASMLSPTNMNLNSPHNHHPAFFSPFQPYAGMMGTLAAAATIPPSPIGGLMGFPPNFSRLGLGGLNSSGSAVTHGNLPGSATSRHTSSALEGKS